MADPYGALANSTANNPFRTLAPLVQMEHGALQNRMLQQTLQGRQALGQIMQQAIDPKTGDIDYGKAALLVSVNPKTAWMAPDFINQMVARRKLQVETTLQEFELNQKRYAAYGNKAMELLQQFGKNVTPGQVAASLADLQSDGLIDTNGVKSFLAQMPTDSAQLVPFLQSVATRSMDAATKLKAVMGDLTVVDRGGTATGIRAPAFGGAPTQVFDAPKLPTPGERNAPVSFVGEGGATYQAPAQDTFPMYSGTGAQINPGVGQPSGGGSPFPMQQPQAGTEVTGPDGKPLQAVPAPVKRQPVMKELPPGTSEYRKSNAKYFGETYEPQLNEQVAQVNTLLQTLAEARDALSKFKPGAGSEVREQLASLAQASGFPKSVYDGIMRGDLGAAQEFQKLMAQLATQTMRQAMGSQRFTNTEFVTFQDRNPNIKTDPRAIERMFDFASRMSKLLVMQQEALGKWKTAAASDPTMDITLFPSWWQKRLMQSGAISYGDKKKGAK